MKKLTLIFAILSLFTCISAKAQKQFYLGAGGNFNSVSILFQYHYGEESDISRKFTPGGAINLNLGADWRLFPDDSSNYLGAKMEIGYIMLGQDFEGTENGVEVYRYVDLSYIQIPALFKYTHGKGNIKFYGLVGFQVDFLLSAKQEFSKDDTTNIHDRVRDASFMLRGDVGADIYLAKNLFVNLGISSGYAITDLTTKEYRVKDPETGKYQITHNFYIGLNVGINFRFDLKDK